MRASLYARPLVLTVLTIAGSTSSARADDAAPAADEGTSMFATLDANDDGQLTADEVGDDKQRLFQRLVRTADTNGDGQLSQDEFRAGLARKPPQGGPAGAAAARRPGPGGPGQRRMDPARMEERFRQWDANGDNQLSLDEVPEQAQELVERMLDRLDANGDDLLALDELRAGARAMQARLGGGPSDGAGPPRGPLLAALDADGNGALSAEEIAAAAEALQRLDTDGDGQVSGEELRAAGPAPEATAGGPPAPTAVAEAGKGLKKMLARLKEADANGDGKLSRDEAPQGIAARFDQFDANGDGALDETEIRQALKNAKGKGKGKGKGKPAPPADGATTPAADA